MQQLKQGLFSTGTRPVDQIFGKGGVLGWMLKATHLISWTYIFWYFNLFVRPIASKMMNVKIATLNLCLGLKNKRLEVERLMINNNVDIMCLQEVEIEKDYDFNALKLNNYCLEVENNSVKARVGIFISNNVNYKRMHQLEVINSHIIIIDITDSCTVKIIINVYRCFNPQGNISALTNSFINYKSLKMHLLRNV